MDRQDVVLQTRQQKWSYGSYKLRVRLEVRLWLRESLLASRTCAEQADAQTQR